LADNRTNHCSLQSNKRSIQSHFWYQLSRVRVWL
jgi:hypothetical protein